MSKEKETIIDQNEDLKISIFDLSEEGASEIIEKEYEDRPEKVEETKVPEDKEEPEDDDPEPDEVEEKEEEETDTEEAEDTDEPEDTDLSEDEKVLSEFITKGKLLLPEDYEYEPSKEGIEKAFEDSEKLRNDLAFRAAIEFLVSDEGLDFVKIQKSQKEVKDLASLNPEEMEVDDKLQIIKDSYADRGFEESEIEEMIEEVIDADKVDKEFNLARKFLSKSKSKQVQEEAIKAETARKEAIQALEDGKKSLRKMLSETKEINGYQLTNKGKESIFDMSYKPVKLKDGTMTTMFNEKLAQVLSNPEQYLILADLLANMDEKGFNFSHIVTKAESKATEKVKKTLRDLKTAGGKAKITEKHSQTKQDFDMSKFSLFGDMKK